MPIAANVILGDGVVIHHPDLVNIYGCAIGAETTIGPFVEIQSDVAIGKLCKIQSHAFVCSGVTLEDEVFVGHGAKFVNDTYPRAALNGVLQKASDWTLVETHVGHGASIGTNATILGGITIGDYAMIGAGAVVTKDVPAYAIVAGAPARIIGSMAAEHAARDRA